jgi:ABC-type uncharacterized transport system fused permease/ATPase subunit
MGKPKDWPVQVALTAALLLGQTFLHDFMFGTDGEMFAALMKQDKAYMLRLIRNSALAALGQSAIFRLYHYVQGEFVTEFSINVVRALTPRYTANNMYYKLWSIDARIKDADQRLCQVFVRAFASAPVLHGVRSTERLWSLPCQDCKNMGFAMKAIYINGARPAFNVVYFTYRIGQFMGAKVRLTFHTGRWYG